MISAALRRKHSIRFKRRLEKQLTDSCCVVFRGRRIKFTWDDGLWILYCGQYGSLKSEYIVTHGKNMSEALQMIREAINLNDSTK